MSKKVNLPFSKQYVVYLKEHLKTREKLELDKILGRATKTEYQSIKSGKNESDVKISSTAEAVIEQRYATVSAHIEKVEEKTKEGEKELKIDDFNNWMLEELYEEDYDFLENEVNEIVKAKSAKKKLS